jgi:hypothetical protein
MVVYQCPVRSNVNMKVPSGLFRLFVAFSKSPVSVSNVFQEYNKTPVSNFSLQEPTPRLISRFPHGSRGRRLTFYASPPSLIFTFCTLYHFPPLLNIAQLHEVLLLCFW